ncbi:hypothetical protein ACFFGT_25680 [Mucilaginibacter angelicae]|uniref:Lipocalin-like domain-containing protein n=1 Tax=Mucilaginibacter angelicae TaxID=869718 RepID=A0ABV6LDR6_9SPHI
MKAIIMLLLLTGLWNSTPPKDVTGKWQVDHVDISGSTMKMSEQEKAMMIKTLKTVFLNAVFDFNANHHFYITPAVKSMPKGDWEYNPEKGIIRIKEVNNTGTIMLINVVEKDGSTVFEMVETQLVLKVHRKS